MTYEEALDRFRQVLQAALAAPDEAETELLLLAATAVAAWVPPAERERLRAWGRDVRRWPVLPRTERERLAAAGLRHAAVLALTTPLDKPRTARAPRSGAPRSPRPRSGSALDATPPAPKRSASAAPTAPAAASTTPPRAPPPAEPLSPTAPLCGLPGVGPVTAARLAARGLRTVADVLHFVPRRWEDLRQVVDFAALRPGQPAVTQGQVRRTRVIPARGRRFLEVEFADATGRTLRARWFHFRAGLAARFAVGARFGLSGTPRLGKAGALELVHPETWAEEIERPPAIRVRYPEVEGVPAHVVERLCREVAERATAPDGLPPAMCARLELLPQEAALRALHLPPADLPAAALVALNEGTAAPQRRLVFDEFFFLQLGLARRRGRARRDRGVALLAAQRPERALARFYQALPFAPTRAQTRAVAEIARDLVEPHPMHRLVQGDVGAGKTMVAFAACELCCASGLQAALMAPTEILAEQHARTLAPFCAATGRSLALLTASTPRGARADALARLAQGALDLIVGTHALLAERVTFARLGLVVVDEQHRFGVAQRARLRDKGDLFGAEGAPHLLVMTATPIPRTLALTAYGDLDLTVLDELPPGRQPPETRVLSGKRGRVRALAQLRTALAQGRQAYWVCPLIGEASGGELGAVTETAAWLADSLEEVPIGVVHGRLPTAERERVMRAFREGELSVLVATTLIEVGVDVPAASMMVIEGAERFGLAQLHQLRGRIGRGGGRSTCLLLAGGGQGDAAARLAVMAATSDGFLVAEEDLRLRGPGEIFGTRQAGLPRLRYADLLRDAALLRLARTEAFGLLEQDPELWAHPATRAVLEARLAEAELFGEEAG